MTSCEKPSRKRYSNGCRCDECTRLNREYAADRYRRQSMRAEDVAARRLADDPAHWKAYAACNAPGVDPAWFFPEGTDGHGGGVNGVFAYGQARRVCATCPAVKGCLEYAFRHHIIHGMWGGKSPRERRDIARGRRVA